MCVATCRSQVFNVLEWIVDNGEPVVHLCSPHSVSFGEHFFKTALRKKNLAEKIRGGGGAVF